MDLLEGAKRGIARVMTGTTSVNQTDSHPRCLALGSGAPLRLAHHTDEALQDSTNTGSATRTLA